MNRLEKVIEKAVNEASGNVKIPITTSQYFKSRIFEFGEITCSEASMEALDAAIDAGRKDIKKVAEEFATSAGKQVGKKFSVSYAKGFDSENQISASVDMEEWPDGEGFDSWFDSLMKKHNVTVFD